MVFKYTFLATIFMKVIQINVGGFDNNFSYLLDFIAYQNRGWSQFIKRTYDIEKGLAAFYDKIRDPIFLNLRYRFNNLSEEEVFPKSLPDFYRNAEFTLYGTYDTEDRFSMQLLGDVEEKTKELIFTRSLKEAPMLGCSAVTITGMSLSASWARLSFSMTSYPESFDRRSFRMTRSGFSVRAF